VDRYHHLFGELLRQELKLANSENIPALHRRACAWHREFGSPSDAIYHATTAGDIAEASELIFSHWLEARDGAQLETILAWLAGLPAYAVKQDARLCLVQATTLQEVGKIDEANHWLEAALLGNSFLASDAATASGLAACRAINQYFRGDAAGIRETASPALDRDSGGSDYWRSALLTTLGTALFVGGHGDEAAGVLERAVAPANNLVTLWRSFTRWAGVPLSTWNAATPIALLASCATSTPCFINNLACAPTTARRWPHCPRRASDTAGRADRCRRRAGTRCRAGPPWRCEVRPGVWTRGVRQTVSPR
jgi:hypothetical protein